MERLCPKFTSKLQWHSLAQKPHNQCAWGFKNLMGTVFQSCAWGHQSARWCSLSSSIWAQGSWRKCRPDLTSEIPGQSQSCGFHHHCFVAHASCNPKSTQTQWEIRPSQDTSQSLDHHTYFRCIISWRGVMLSIATGHIELKKTRWITRRGRPWMVVKGQLLQRGLLKGDASKASRD